MHLSFAHNTVYENYEQKSNLKNWLRRKYVIFHNTANTKYIISEISNVKHVQTWEEKQQNLLVSHQKHEVTFFDRVFGA